jgi:cation:H+ antiporter
MWNWLLLLTGFLLLIPGAGFLVDAASRVASTLKVPPIVIGLTIVAFGTSAPELVVSVLAAMSGNTEIAISNVVGSNIFNILVILGISAVITPLAVRTKTTWIEIPVCILTAAILMLFAFLPSAGKGIDNISTGEGVFLLLIFGGFAVYNYFLAKNEELPAEKNHGYNISNYSTRTGGAIIKPALIIAVSLVMLIIGGRLIVTAAVSIAYGIGISERIIGLTIIAAGTSLPELATSVVAASKGKTDIAIGNILGSNIFNVCLILGLSALVHPLSVTKGTSNDLFINLLASLLLFIFIFTGKGNKISKSEGLIFIAGYMVYLVFAVF